MLSTRELAEASGLTRQQLRFLDEQKIVVPSRGRARHKRPDSWLYTSEDLQRAKIIGELRYRGLSLRSACRVLTLCWDAISRAKRPAYVIVDAREAAGYRENREKGERAVVKVVFDESEVIKHLSSAQHGAIVAKIIID